MKYDPVSVIHTIRLLNIIKTIATVSPVDKHALWPTNPATSVPGAILTSEPPNSPPRSRLVDQQNGRWGIFMAAN